MFHQLTFTAMKKFPSFSVSSLAFVGIVLLMVANLTGGRQTLKALLICISLVTKDAEMVF